MRRLLLLIVIAAAIALGSAAIWWTFFRDRMADAVALMESHAAELTQIQAIVAANPALCGVDLDLHPLACLRTPNARDRADYARIVALMRSAGVKQMNLHGFVDNNDYAIGLWIYDSQNPLIDNGGIVAEWNEHDPDKDCRPIRVPGWRVCNVKGFVVLP